jgi:hypothetical protein
MDSQILSWDEIKKYEDSEWDNVVRNYLISEEDLKNMLNHISLVSIMKYQQVSIKFCEEILLNEYHQLMDEERYITLDDVKRYQKCYK